MIGCLRVENPTPERNPLPLRGDTLPYNCNAGVARTLRRVPQSSPLPQANAPRIRPSSRSFPCPLIDH